MEKNEQGGSGRPQKEIGDYQSGYCKPPKDKQWQKGTSGNPRGRPKKVPTMAECMADELSRLTLIPEKGRLRKRSLRTVLCRGILHDALNGDHKARSLVLKLDADRPEPEAIERDLSMWFTLKLEEDDPGPHWQLIEDGHVIDEG